MGKAGIGPIRLEPVYKKAIWAGERLKKIRGLQEDGIGLRLQGIGKPGGRRAV